MGHVSLKEKFAGHGTKVTQNGISKLLSIVYQSIFCPTLRDKLLGLSESAGTERDSRES